MYSINYAWEASTQLTMINSTTEKMLASEALKEVE